MDWVASLGLPPGEVSLVDADAFAHLQTCPRQKLRFVGHHPLRRPHHPRITGTFDVPDISGNIYFAFRYNVVRVWQLDVGELLEGALSTLPFAPISNVRPTGLGRVIKMMRARIEAEATGETEEGELWTATNIFMGLRYDKTFRNQMRRGIYQIRESNAYQQILREGRAEGRAEGLTQGRTEGQVEGALREARRILLRQGMRRLGVAPPAIEARVRDIGSLTVLEELLDRVLDVEAWDGLLDAI